MLEGLKAEGSDAKQQVHILWWRPRCVRINEVVVLQNRTGIYPQSKSHPEEGNLGAEQYANYNRPGWVKTTPNEDGRPIPQHIEEVW